MNKHHRHLKVGTIYCGNGVIRMINRPGKQAPSAFGEALGDAFGYGVELADSFKFVGASGLQGSPRGRREGYLPGSV